MNTFIVCYSPTNSSDGSDIDNVYNEVRSLLESIPVQNFVTIAGDFNAKVGTEDVKFIFNDLSLTGTTRSFLI